MGTFSLWRGTFGLRALITAEIPIPPAHCPEKGKKRWFRVPRTRGDLWASTEPACGPSGRRDLLGAVTFAFGLLAGAGIAAWMVPPV